MTTEKKTQANPNKKRNVLQTVAFMRDGQRIVPEVGKPFMFTQEEIDQLNKLNPDALGKILVKEDENKTQEDTISMDQHNALIEQARKDAVEQFKKEQGADSQLKGEGDVKNATGAAPTGTAQKSGKADGASKTGTGADKSSSDDDI